MHTAGKWIWHNGALLPAKKKIIAAQNRGFRYGDGLFETIKVLNENILLSAYHWERLFAGLHLLNFTIPSFFTENYIETAIKQLLHANKHLEGASVRCMVYRGEGNVWKANNLFPHLLIESNATQLLTNPLPPLHAGLYTQAKKSCDAFSFLKHNNYLCYVMAALWAQQHNYNEAIVLNNYNRIAETTVANLFLLTRNGNIKTPSLQEGCIGGVMRRHVLDTFKKANVVVEETQIEWDDVVQAEEIFITNTQKGIQSIENCEGRVYQQNFASKAFERFIKPLWQMF